ncbi:DUF4402 domain-containing protein [Fusobacterium varium]|jgi:hypothetical protein|uniref:DUF4402 domain-containing protein n=1 Tax=Fusobacterium varium ATCC 27725 TaxID=469618 RepID=A0ABM6U473_FUSVA|nr:DUF4402 domain-containing protein [Fusobacterium varium]AVQ31095.1 hypothetical protein C4N18_07685 [Fusobacterium varium ATCC 27725]EES62413.1 hypothetical protein FVAG_00102 [Fusobacterium varium ATCC 27725]VEH40219.1 Uncharacterised protein [Fusobacterium varium]
MKKLLLLSSILAISTTIFGAGMSSSDDLKVTAQIIKPLSITTKEVNFGIITVGQKNISTEGTSGDGKIEVNGEANSNVRFQLDGLSSSIILKTNDSANTLSANLKGVNSSSSSESSTNLAELFDRQHALNENGSIAFIIHGTIPDVPEGTASGLYTGTVKITAKYDFNSNK